MTAYELYRGADVGCLTVIDAFAQERGTRGLLPAPIPPLRFTFVARDDGGGNMLPLATPVVLSAQSGASGAYLFPDETRIGDTSRSRVAPARYTLRIESDFYLTLDADLDWPFVPPPAQPLLLVPSSSYPFPDVTVPAARLTLLRGNVVEEGSGAPVFGALVAIIDPPNLGTFSQAFTDARGAWVLAVRLPAAPPERLLQVRITLPGGGVVDVADVKVRPSAENSLGQTALRGQVLTTAGNAVAGAKITVDSMPGKSVFTGRDGAWAFYFGPNQPDGAAQVSAKAPNGQSQSQNADVFERKTTVVPAFRFAVN